METHAVDAERRIRKLVAASKNESFLIELNSQVSTLLVGPGGSRLEELEKETNRQIALKGRQRAPHDHFVVLTEGSAADVEPQAAPVQKGQELKVELEAAHLHAETDAIARLNGYVITVAGAAAHVGEKVAIRIEDVGKTSAHGVLVSEDGGQAPADGERPKKKTRRGSRGGRGRKKKTTTTAGAGQETDVAEPDAPAEPETASEPEQGDTPAEEKPKKKTRRGSRGGRGRKRKPVQSAPEAGQESPLS
jgi:predicted RNA-binding protein with TRAM domain